LKLSTNLANELGHHLMFIKGDNDVTQVVDEVIASDRRRKQLLQREAFRV